MARFDHFDFIAPVYERLIKPIDPITLQSIIGLPVEGIMLDAGGGTGRISYQLRDLSKSVVIADPSIGMLLQAQKKPGLKTVCSISEQLPFNDETFDRVIMVDALHHVLDVEATLDELWRVTRRDGRLVIGEPDIRYVPAKIIAILEKLLLMRSHFISPQNIQRAYQKKNLNNHILQVGITSWIIVEK